MHEYRARIESMAERCLIVGGGVVGLTTARRLCMEGFEVTVLERGRTGREASWAAGGILAPMYPWQFPDAVTELYKQAAAQYPHLANVLAEESGVDPEWVQSGMLIFDTEERRQALEWSKRHHISMDVVSGDDAVLAEPGIAKNNEEALWFPDMAQIRPPRMMKALRKSIVARGGTIQDKVAVTAVNVIDDRVMGVETSEGPIFADLVVIAGGAWSGELFESVGLKTEIEPVRGQMILYRAQPGSLSRMVQFERRYLIPRRDGRILVGSTVEYVGFKKETTRDAVESLQKAAVRMMPSLEKCKIEKRWAGLRPGKKDGVPIIGAHPSIEGLYINTGHFRNGIVLSPASADLLTDLIKSAPLSIDPKPYEPR